MIYTDNTRKAIKIAYKAHMDQTDRSGIPYVFHPYHLAEQMDTEEKCIVALLHDVVEDTSVTMEELSKEFSKDIIDALKLLTHDKSVPYMDYVKEIKNNEIAKCVKLADLKHNSDNTRLKKLSDKDIERNEKYRKAIEYLNS